MLIPEEKFGQVVGMLRSFGAKRVLLFGSYVRDPENARDIDLAAEGIRLTHLWRADGRLSDILNVPCDLVVCEENPDFYDLIKRNAKVLYEQTGVD